MDEPNMVKDGQTGMLCPASTYPMAPVAFYSAQPEPPSDSPHLVVYSQGNLHPRYHARHSPGLPSSWPGYPSLPFFPITGAPQT